MPQAAVAAANWLASAVLTVTSSATLAAAAGNAVLALGFAQGAGAALGAWATVAAVGSALDPPKLGSSGGASQVEWKADPNAGIPCVVGRTGTAGNIVCMATTGDKGRYINFVTVHSLGPIQGYEGFYANKELVTFTTPGRNGEEAAGRYLNRMWRKQVLGTPGQAAMGWTATGSKDTPADHGGSVSGFWTAQHTLTGLAGTLLCLSTDTKVFPSGAPKPIDVVLGPAVYDPRADSTYPGGSGPQRIDDETTWGFTGNRNAYLQALTFAIGRKVAGVTVIGLGAPPESIDIASFVEGANVADANGWTIGGTITSADGKWDVFRAMLIAGGGMPAPGGDRIGCIVNAPRTSLATLTGDDVVGAWSVQAGQSRRNRPNQIIPTYRSEDHDWQLVPAAAVKVDDYVAADGRLRSRGVTYDLVQDAGQAAQLAAYDIVNVREFGPITLPCKPKWTGYRIGDCITIDDDELGLDGQKALILGRKTDYATGVVTLTLRSETDGKHPFALGQTPHPPPTPGLSGHDPGIVPAPAEGAWSVVATYVERDGSRTPVVIVTGEVDDPNASEILVGSRMLDLDGEPADDWVWTPSPASSVRIVLYGLVALARYQIGVRYKTVRGIENPDVYLDLGEVTVPALVASAGAVTTIGGQTADEFVADVRAVRDRAEALARTVASVALAGQSQDEKLRKAFGYTRSGLPIGGFAERIQQVSDTLVYDRNLLGIRSEDGLAFILRDSTVRRENGETIASTFEQIAVQQGEAAAAITEERNARIGQGESFAEILTGVTSMLVGNIASVSVLMESVNGLSAQWVLAVSSSGGGVTRIAGIKAAASDVVSSLAFAADEIGFTHDGLDYFPFSIVGGVVRATNFEVDRLKANSIETDWVKVGALWTSVVAQTDSVLSVSADTDVELISAGIAASGDTIVALFNGTFQAPSSRSHVFVQLYRNGSPVGEVFEISLDGEDVIPISIPFTDNDAEAGSVNTYSVVKLSGNGGWKSRTLSLNNAKRAG